MSDSRPPFDPFGPSDDGPALPPSPPVADSWAAPGAPADLAPGPGSVALRRPPDRPRPARTPPRRPAPTSGPYGGPYTGPYAGYPGSFGAPSPTPPPAPPANARRHNQLAFLGGLLVATLLIAAVVLVHNGLNSNVRHHRPGRARRSRSRPLPPARRAAGPPATAPRRLVATGSGTGSGTALSTEAITAAVEPGVVDIDTRLGYQSAAAAGTGMILTSNGYVLTNNHVIDGATSITATVVGTGRTYTATVVGTDVSQDVAVLRLSGASGLATVPLGDSPTVSTGDKVVAIGNAGGTGGDPTVVTGTVTDLNQSITASDENGTNAEQLTGLIVTNAPIVAGDSGRTARRTTRARSSASTPPPRPTTSSCRPTAPASPSRSTGPSPSPRRSSPATRPTRSTSGRPASSASPWPRPRAGTRQRLGNAAGSVLAGTDPATVSTVIAGSPADKAGIAAGDTITAFDGTSISTRRGAAEPDPSPPPRRPGLDLVDRHVGPVAPGHHHPGHRPGRLAADRSGAAHTPRYTTSDPPAGHVQAPAGRGQAGERREQLAEVEPVPEPTAALVVALAGRRRR